MQRKSIKRPGYDCIRNPCGKRGCGTFPGSNHGIHSDEWIYSVIGDAGDCALSLVVFSGVYPPSVPPMPHAIAVDYPMGADLSMHTAFPTDRERLLRADAGGECDLLAGGRCFCSWTSCTAAGDFVKAHLGPNFEQPESFWLALEERFVALAKQMRAGRVDLDFERCPKCDGVGTVRRSP